MKSLYSVALLGVCGLLLLSCGGSSIDDWEPSTAVQTYELVIVDSITVDDVGGGYDFLSVSDVGRGGVGEILVLDGESACIYVFDASGSYLDRVGRSARRAVPPVGARERRPGDHHSRRAVGRHRVHAPFQQ